MKFRLALVASWREIIRYPSIWLAFVASALTGFIMSNPTFILSVVAFFPSDLQLPAAMVSSLFVLVLVVATRALKLDRGATDGSDEPDNQTKNG